MSVRLVFIAALLSSFLLLCKSLVNPTDTTPANDNTTTVVPVPTVPVYSVKNDTSICLLVQMNVLFRIMYFNKKGEKVSANFFLNSSSGSVPNVTGECGSNVQLLHLAWFPEPHKPSWGMDMQFSLRASSHFSLDLLAFNFTVTDEMFPNTNETNPHFMSHNASEFTCPLGSYFQCQSHQTFKLSEVLLDPKRTARLDAYMTISSLRAEAFRTSPDPLFVGHMTECSADFVPNKVVPVVVGVALAIMIVIALATFIIANRRCRNGYQTI